MSAARRAGPALRKRIELLVVVLIVAALVGVLSFVIVRTREAALALRCRQRLRGLYTALQRYALDNDGYLPLQDDRGWRESVGEFLEGGRLGPEERRLRSTCPAGEYVGNRSLFAPDRTLDTFRLRLEIGLLADGPEAGPQIETAGSDGIGWRHMGGANVLFVDGHVDWVDQAHSQRIRRHWDAPQ